VYRKGIDLLNVVVPAVCRRQPHVDFIIGARPAWFQSSARQSGAVPGTEIQSSPSCNLSALRA
jgi:hypothetical protein